MDLVKELRKYDDPIYVFKDNELTERLIESLDVTKILIVCSRKVIFDKVGLMIVTDTFENFVIKVVEEYI